MDVDTKSFIGLFAAACIFLFCGVGLLRHVRARSKAILRKWADESGYEILEQTPGFYAGGPFKWWTTNRNQTVFLLRVRSREGRERTCWARCGSSGFGVFFSDAIEIRWDEP